MRFEGKGLNMIAIVEIKGKQYKVAQGSIIDVDLFSDAQKDTSMVFDQVLLVANDGKLEVGHPFLTNVKVEAEVLNPLFKDDKVIVFKYKRKTGFKKKQGHRQKYTTLRITSIKSETLGTSKAAEKPVKAKTAKKATTKVVGE